MGSPLPPDPYLALGVPKDATPAAIKTAHRKLVLKWHPDKVSDPAAKQAASDQFHIVQTSYEILIDQDRRERYDAQVRLAELRREKLERQGSGGARGSDQRPTASPYRSSYESAPRSSYGSWDAERGATPQTEERKPAYAKEYFDSPPRASARKEPEFERTSRRSTTDTPKPKSRTSAREAKDSEREKRREKTRRTERDTQRDRDRKYNTVVEEEVESNSDEYERRSRRVREEDEAATARKARAAYYEQASKQQQEAEKGYFDDRTRKMYAASADAWDYIRSSHRREPERRPSPVRQGSTKDKYEYVTRKDGRPAAVSRRPSERPKTLSREAVSSRMASREQGRERRSSAEFTDDMRRPPTLNQTRSSPADIHIPPEKPRAQSVQIESDAPEMPRVKRAETMPYNSQYRGENVVPSKGSNLRATETIEGLTTPATTPEYTSTAAANPLKYRYGRQYADDVEVPTPDGYRTSTSDSYQTEVREPVSGNPRSTFTRRITRSPSPVKDYRDPRESRDVKDKLRSASARYTSPAQTPPLNARTTSYVFAPGHGVEAREGSGRGMSPRDPALYGEINRSSGESPRPKYNSYTVPEESVRYQRPSTRPEELRTQSGYGYSRRGAGDRPGVSRTGSSNTAYTSVRAA